jgi:hypothetical protein
MMSRIKKWVGQSLVGHVVFFEILIFIPAITYGVVSNYVEGTLSLDFAIEMAVEVAAIVAIAAAAVWFFVTVPLKRRTGR